MSRQLPCCLRPRVTLFVSIVALLALLAIETACGGAASTNPALNGNSLANRGATPPSSAPTIAAYAYVGNASEMGHVSDFPISSQGIPLSAAGSSTSGASGLLAVTPHFVFATDGRYIVTYTRGTNGGLRQTSSVDGTAHNITPPGSFVGPLTVDRTGSTLYAAEIEFDGTDNDAYSVWTINSDGSLTWIANSNINVDYNTFLSFTHDNRYAYGFGCYFIDWDITGLARNSDGTLTSFDTGAINPPSNDFLCPSDVQTSTTYAVVAYIDVEMQGAHEQLVSYTIASDGTLGLLLNSVVTTPFLGERSMAFDPTGTYLAVAGDYGIQMYQLGAGGSLTAIGSVVDNGIAFSQLKWDNSNHLYAISGGAGGLYVFNSVAGVLTQDPGPLPLVQAGSLAVLSAQ